jgi:hypothetical protein
MQNRFPPPAQVPHEWLPEPRTEVSYDDAGVPEAAYIAVRTGRAFRVVRPNANHLVFLYLGHDDVPVGISMLEPVTGEVQTEILFHLISSPDGSAVGVCRQVHHTFTPGKAPAPGFIESTLSRFREANDKLQTADA